MSIERLEEAVKRLETLEQQLRSLLFPRFIIDSKVLREDKEFFKRLASSRPGEIIPCTKRELSLVAELQPIKLIVLEGVKEDDQQPNRTRTTRPDQSPPYPTDTERDHSP